jgi:hypothetical protein
MGIDPVDFVRVDFGAICAFFCTTTALDYVHTSTSLAIGEDGIRVTAVSKSPDGDLPRILPGLDRFCFLFLSVSGINTHAGGKNHQYDSDCWVHRCRVCLGRRCWS